MTGLYAHRRAHRLCVTCGADLKPLDGWVVVRCPECHEANRRAQDRRAKTPRGRALNAAWCAARYRRNLAARLCVETCGRPAADDCARCEECRASHSERVNRYLDRKEAACG